MAGKALLSVAVALAFVSVPTLSASAMLIGTVPTGVMETIYDEYDRVLYEIGVEPSNPLLAYSKHYHHRDGHGGGGGGGGGGGDDGGGGGGSDCTSTAYKDNGWFWASAYSATASSYASTLDASAETWDAATGADIFGSISSGSQATAGVQDYVNQMDWTHLGDGGTIAVTTTWYYRGSGEAVESDAEYNTYYSWSTNGASDAMDVQNIGTHEIGHTFGLGHPNGGGVECLTMYAYGDYGETQKRTLGDGDILGIRAIYGS